MLTAEHQRPLAAFFLVFAVACLIMANGLRTQVVDVLIGSGAPRQLITAIAPDMVLGQSLRNAPVRPQTTVEAPVSVEAPVQPAAPAEVVTVTQSRVQAVPRRAEAAKPASRASKRAARPGGGPATAPGEVAPAPTPAPAPAPAKPQPIPGVRIPGIHVPQVPVPGGRSAWAPRDESRDNERGNSERAHARNDRRGSWTAPSRSESVQTRDHADTRPTWDNRRGSHDGGDRRSGSGSHHGGWRGDSDRGHRGEARGHGRTDRGQSNRGQTRRGHGGWGGHGRSGHGR